jgi:ribosomal protein S18 acetylase RimI-like enzyme
MGEAAIVLRAMQAQEREAVARLWWESSESAPIADAEHPSVEARVERLARETWNVILASRGSRIVGLLAIDAQESWLRQLYVAPEEKRSGVGTVLLDEAKRLMPAGFFLHTDAENRPAIGFYEARGLRLESEGPHPESGRLRLRFVWPGAPAARSSQGG